MNSTGRAAALDAGVTASPTTERKARAAVDYYQRELDAAADVVGRLQDKHDKLTAQAKQAAEDVKAAKADVKAAGERLNAAKTALEGGF